MSQQSTGQDALRAAELSAALRESTARLAGLFERGLAGAFRSTPAGRLLEVNPALVALLGYERAEELLGVPAAQLYVEPADRRALLASLERTGEGVLEVRLRRRDGKTVWALGRAARRRTVEGEEVIEGTVLDLTPIRESEAGVVEAGRLAALGALAAGVAHEVNSPLAGILANLAYAIEALPGAAPRQDEAVQDVLSALEDARAAAERVRDIVRDLRLFARVDEGERAPLEISAVLEATLGLVENQLRHRARVVRVIGEAPRVVADASSLGQALLNLLLDAAQAIPEGAAARNTLQVTLGRTSAGDARLEISNTGPGMTPEALARALDPHLPRRPGGPVGMGLPVARVVIESLGGTMAVRSEPGTGTTVQVDLPAAPASSRAATPAAAGPRARRRVLVVDDEPVVGKSLRRLLPEHDLVLATSAAEALSAIEADPELDVVLCDLMMPEVSGVELYHALEARFPALARRVVFITGGAFTPEAAAFLRQVGNPVLEKPFDLRRLRALVGGRAEARG